MEDALLRKHLELVIEANKKTNITRIDSIEDGMIFHVQDSLSALPEVEKAPAGRYADIGSGAGYPGIPLAIATGRETLLIESIQKKARILDSFIKELDLNKVRTYAGRVEELALNQRESFSLVTARAVAKLPVLMELSSPLLKQEGILVCYKALVSEDELQHALRLQKTLAMKMYSDRSFLLEGKTRRILSFKKEGNPSLKLPRAIGMAQNKPLQK